jgi:alanine dehydrogenase
MHILTRADITALVDVAALIAPVAAAMQRVSERRAELPLRSMVNLGAGNALGVMPGALADPPVHGAKLLSLFPQNPRHGRSSHAGLMLIFDPETGLPRACMDASVLTALRTAAASAVATQALARPDATILGVIGCGEQAHAHLAAMRAVRDIRRVVVWGRDPARLAAFARAHGTQTADSIADVVAQADILCTTTNATSPLLQPEMLHPGQHVNAVGASIPAMQEIATECLPRVSLFTDFLPSLEAQAAEVIDARRRQIIAADHVITEIGSVLLGSAIGRRDAAAITLYRSLGVAAQDLAAAQFILERAEQTGRGVVVDMD